MRIEVYTDGSATTKNKPGGWAYVIVIDDTKYAECSGHLDSATNNDAELEAAIQGLGAVAELLTNNRISLKLPALTTHSPLLSVFLCSDSELILGWASGRYNFKQAEKMDKYYSLQKLVNLLDVKTRWIKGHSGDEYIERCDKLANEARLGVNRNKDKADAILEGKTLIGTKKLGVICLWYKNCLKVVDFETNIIEDY